jgi:Protein of unknown function (DUF2946)
MERVRRRRRYGASLAIAAMALQFLLSFGHVHVHGGRGTPIVLASAHSGVGAPAQGQNKPDDEDYCAICATIALLSGSVTAMPPQLALPVVSAVVEHADRIAIAAIGPRRAPYQSRAPPSA